MAIEAKKIKVEIGHIPKNKKKDVIYFKDFNAMNKVLNSNRVQILEVVKRKRPESIYKLAELVKRDQGNVTKDIKILKKYGFVEIKKTKEGKRVKSEPQVDTEVIEMIVKLGAGALGIAKDTLESVTSEFREDNLAKNKDLVKKQYEKVTKDIAKPVKKAAGKVAKELEKISK